MVAVGFPDCVPSVVKLTVMVLPTLDRVVDALLEEMLTVPVRDGDVLSKVMLLPLVSDDTCVPALPARSVKLAVNGIVPVVSPLCIVTEANQDVPLPTIEATLLAMVTARL